uniref:Putative thiol methyltransferase 2 isoform X2 n=1 Tax=Rhizophora mucronata TaxID=61149 RepID=A0A2P2KLS7_RHIMU
MRWLPLRWLLEPHYRHSSGLLSAGSSQVAVASSRIRRGLSFYAINMEEKKTKKNGDEESASSKSSSGVKLKTQNYQMAGRSAGN